MLAKISSRYGGDALVFFRTRRYALPKTYSPGEVQLLIWDVSEDCTVAWEVMKTRRPA